jgi:hypothetical protein
MRVAGSGEVAVEAVAIDDPDMAGGDLIRPDFV